MTRPSVPGPKCLSGLADKTSEISACDKMCGDPCTATHVTDKIVATTPRCAASQISDKTVHTSDAYKLFMCVVTPIKHKLVLL